ncbi:hypothetical protein [Streptomyces finlayi]|nr:hypothetical protein [Streptomyces finlayi]
MGAAMVSVLTYPLVAVRLLRTSDGQWPGTPPLSAETAHPW